MSRPDVLVFAIRLAAVILIVIVVPLLWRIMIRLPWQIDCVIATVSAFAFAYAFEHEDRA